MPLFDAAIFDLDGLLIDSEPCWRRAEIEVFAALGVTLTDAECHMTTGLRTDQVVAYWLERRPWDTQRDPAAHVTADINSRVIELIGEAGEAKVGVDAVLDLMRRHGLRLALASASAMPVIDASLQRLRLAATFEVVHSVDFESNSKPAPDVYLGAARRLGVQPARCIAFEDSLPGVQAAKAAGMFCVRIPEQGGERSTADLEFDSLAAIDASIFQAF